MQHEHRRQQLRKDNCKPCTQCAAPKRRGGNAERGLKQLLQLQERSESLTQSLHFLGHRLSLGPIPPSEVLECTLSLTGPAQCTSHYRRGDTVRHSSSREQLILQSRATYTKQKFVQGATGSSFSCFYKKQRIFGFCLEWIEVLIIRNEPQINSLASSLQNRK